MCLGVHQWLTEWLTEGLSLQALCVGFILQLLALCTPQCVYPCAVQVINNLAAGQVCSSNKAVIIAALCRHGAVVDTQDAEKLSAKCNLTGWKKRKRTTRVFESKTTYKQHSPTCHHNKMVCVCFRPSWKVSRHATHWTPFDFLPFSHTLAFCFSVSQREFPGNGYTAY